ncbi:hypothetical protein NL676_005270 [Syzygium grande]|nr:hypothetical protein NL676_005270 [Syzygium grande]
MDLCVLLGVHPRVLLMQTRPSQSIGHHPSLAAKPWPIKSRRYAFPFSSLFDTVWRLWRGRPSPPSTDGRPRPDRRGRPSLDGGEGRPCPDYALCFLIVNSCPFMSSVGDGEVLIVSVPVAIFAWELMNEPHSVSESSAPLLQDPGGRFGQKSEISFALVDAHIRDGDDMLKKPVLFTEVGSSLHQNQQESYQRDMFFKMVYDKIYESAKKRQAGAGALIWQLLVDDMQGYADQFSFVAWNHLSTYKSIMEQSCRLRRMFVKEETNRNIAMMIHVPKLDLDGYYVRVRAS